MYKFSIFKYSQWAFILLIEIQLDKLIFLSCCYILTWISSASKFYSDTSYYVDDIGDDVATHSMFTQETT